MRVVKILTLAAVIGFAAEIASAQEGAVSRLYGSGVHAYFSGDLRSAEKLLTDAINAGSQDPRCHYFRGLIYLQAGRQQAAAAEFEQGADLEAGATRAYDVSLALERIQGRQRLALEQHRAAKLASATSATRVQRRQRMDAIHRREPVTTVAPVPAMLDAITGDAAPLPATPLTAPSDAAKPEVEAPFADPLEATPPAADAAKAAPVAAPAEASADPFGADDALPSDDTPADESAPADDASADPFGEQAADEEVPASQGAADKAPAKEEAAPTDEEAADPFATDDKAPADDAAPPTDGAPAKADANDADPFGTDDAAADDGAAEPPADDAATDAQDPFGSE